MYYEDNKIIVYAFDPAMRKLNSIEPTLRQKNYYSFEYFVHDKNYFLMRSVNELILIHHYCKYFVAVRV